MRSPPTCVAVALVGGDGQVAEVGAGVVLRGPAHHQLHQALGAADGGHRLGVGHARHQLLVHLQTAHRVSLAPGCSRKSAFL